MLNLRRTLSNLLEEENMRVLGAGYLCKDENKISATFSKPASGKTTFTVADNAFADNYSLEVSTAYLLGAGNLCCAYEYADGSSYSNNMASVALGSSPKITLSTGNGFKALNYIIFEVDD